MASKSLGTLTLDLIAQVGGFTAGMDKAERSSLKWRKEVEKNAKAVGIAIGGAVVAGATALTAITISTINSAKEISNLSNVANASTTEFQKYAAGAKLVGIEQDKLADIFKDVNDKVGDFLNTGGGALQDFFTNIAPKVGVTADQFRNLSGPQALGLYVSSLEKAKVSQSDMTFYLEAIASDATALLPLLRNNSEGFKAFGEAAAAAGAIMDEKTIKSANELAAAQWLIEQSTTGLKNQLTTQLLPVLSAFAGALLDVTKQGTAMVAVGQFVVETIKWMAKSAVGAVAAFDLIGKAIGGVAAIAAAGFKDASWTDLAMGPAALGVRLAKNWDGIKSTAADVGSSLESEALKWGGYFEKIDDAGRNGTSGTVKSLSDLMDQLGRLKNAPGTFHALTKEEQAAQKAAEQAAKALQKRFDDAETGYERQIALINTEVDKRKDATEVAKLQFEIESGKLKGINAQQQERLNGLAAELDRLKKLKQANEDAAKAAAFGSTLDQENSTAAAGFDIELAGAGMGDKYRARLQELLQIRQSYNEKQADLNKQYNSGEISKELYDKETSLLQEAMGERLKIQEDYYAKVDEAQKNWQDGVSDAFQNYVDSATDYSRQAADAVSGVLGDATSGLSDGIYGLITQTEDLNDALANVATTIGQSIIKAISDMAAQWLIYQALELAGVQTNTAAKIAGAQAAASAQIAAISATTTAAATATTATTATQTAAAAETAAAWTPAAIASSIGSFGTAAAIGLAAVVAALAFKGGFKKGGYTGDAGVNDVAGVVHGKEFVFDAAATSRIGVDNLEALRAGKLDTSIGKASAAMIAANNDNRSTVINFYQQGGGSSREQQASTAKAARQIARAVDAAGRYS